MGGRGGEVVVSGVAARLPEADSVDEFAAHLLQHVDMVTADARRWPHGLHGPPQRTGKLKNLKHFDAAFFGVHSKLASVMDPQQRLALELTHEAFVDAGLNPVELRGSRTGVFVGISDSETVETGMQGHGKLNGYEVLGCSNAMVANRISYAFDLKGPSYAVDTGCSSSMFALSQALAAIRAGLCDAAVVAGTNLCPNPVDPLSFNQLGMLSKEGRCAAFDSDGNGYVPSEAVVVMLLQKRADARRAYATVHAARTNNDGYKEHGITFPSGVMQKQLAEETFEEARLRPQDVVYVEAHGTGTKAGDPQEVNAIAEVFCKERTTPLLLGSVKSNMGHAEPASGLCSVLKVIVAMERGVIPANLHFNSPNPDIPALIDGRIKVVDTNTAWNGGLVAINSFGFGGANGHAILESERTLRPPMRNSGAVPRVLLASGRTEQAVQALLEHAARHRDDAELHALMDAVHAQNIPGHSYRGYCVLASQDAQEIIEVEEGCDLPLWFVFSGIGSHCAGVGRELMRLPVFAATVARAAAVLRSHHVDLEWILTKAPEAAFEDAVTAMVSITTVQVALVEVLRAVGLRPNGVIGISLGELGCAYADDTLTVEQTVLAAYWRGRCVLDAQLAPGCAASVRLSHEQCQRLCPPDVYITGHLSADTVVVAGPPAAVEQFVAALTAEGVVARRADSDCGVAFHCELVAPAAAPMRARLQALIPEPRPRSARWISTSVPQNKQDHNFAKLSSAEYFVNNFLSPVNLAAAMQAVPERALVVEVAPHALLRGLLQRARPAASVAGLLRRGAPDMAAQLLQALGKLYALGAQPRVGQLSALVPWPVARGTPGLGARVRWDHSAEWGAPRARGPRAAGQGSEFELDLSRDDDAFLAGHEVDGRILFPAAGYIVLVWRAIAKLHNKKFQQTPIVIEDFHLKRATVLTRDSPTRFLVNVLEGSDEFSVSADGSVVASGRARLTTPNDQLLNMHGVPHPAHTPLPLTTEDVYQELRLRGYDYKDSFRSIKSADARGDSGELMWRSEWVSFIDSLMQFATFRKKRGLYLPARIQRVFIDPRAQQEAVDAATDHDTPALAARFFEDTDVAVCGGVELHGIGMSLGFRHTQESPKLEKHEFVPYNNSSADYEKLLTKHDALNVSVQLALENAGELTLKLAEWACERPAEALLTPLAIAALRAEPRVRVEASVTTDFPSLYDAATKTTLQEIGVQITSKLESECHLVQAANVLHRGASALCLLAGALAARGMLLLEEPRGALGQRGVGDALARAGLALVSRLACGACEYVLLRRPVTLPEDRVVIEVGDDDDYKWVEPLREAMRRAETRDMRIYLHSHAACSGVLGLGACLRREPGGRAVRVFFAPGACHAFHPEADAYRAQVQSDLACNVLRADAWGSYRHLLLSDPDDAQIQTEHAYVNTLARGDLSSLRWIESPLRYAADQKWGPDTELCRVYYAPINSRDVILAAGQLPSDALPDELALQEGILGLEFSGRSSSGKRVMGMVPSRGLATTVAADKAFLWDVPPNWSLEEAATVPVAYSTAYYALTVRGRMQRGESVLIHEGAGGVGQAAIAIALHAGCTVFTTVGTADERAFLRQRFPQLADANIGNSRDVSFEQLVLRRTRSRGVDLVLNSLAGDKLLASTRCLAEGGRFLEIGNLDLSENTPLGMSVFLKNASFHGVPLGALLTARAAERAAVRRCVEEGLASCAVRPLPATLFARHQLEQAFRYMATGEHIGKVVLRVRAEEPSAAPLRTPLPAPLLVSASPRTYFHPTKSYVILGGLGGLGLELCSWLVQRGATTLVLNSRGGVRNGYQAWCIHRWREEGVVVEVTRCDASTAVGARQLLQTAAALAPVGGVFNLAAVIRDSWLQNLTPEDYRLVALPKVNVTKELDRASRELAPALEHFVVFSSVACGRGSAGQTNYGLANSVMERVCERRRAHGLPALALQWGPIAEVGLMSQFVNPELVISGYRQQTVASYLAALDALMTQPHVVAASRLPGPPWRAAAHDAPSHDTVQVIANILGIQDLRRWPAAASLAKLGADSLICAEVKDALQQRHALVLAVDEVRGLTLARIRELTGKDEL